MTDIHRAEEVNANLTKAAASLPDMRELLRMWDPEESPEEFQDRAVGGNLLGKDVRSRTRDLVRDVFLRRFFRDGDRAPAHRLHRIITSEQPRIAADRMLYYETALAEHFLYRVATEVIYCLRQEGHPFVENDDVLEFLSRVEAEGGPSYSKSVAVKLARSSLTALRDFGVLEGKSKKRIAPVQLPPPVVGYVAYSLKDEGHTANGIVQHTDWRLFLLSPTDAERAIIDASGYGWFRYQAAGSIRRFDWSFEDTDEFVRHVI